jgi:simple sugar transport system substrate-binding protein
MKEVLMKKVLAVVLMTALVISATSLAMAQDKMKFFVVSHGGPADPFWGVVMKGAKDAGKEFNVDVTYLGPQKYSVQELVNMVEQAVAAKPNGLAVTITDAQALDQPLKDAIASGIPVIAINVPDYRGFAESIPYLAYVGADDYKVGIEAARRMLQEFAPEKPKRGVVSIHEVGHAGLEARARGITEVFTEAGIPVEKLATSPNASETYQVIDAYLTKNPDTEAVFCLGPLDTHPTITLLEEKDLIGKVKLGGVDLSETMIKAIKEDKLAFTVEQQQYLQGYLPINLLILYNKYGLIPHDDILTGPAIVDKSNVAIVEDMVAKNYR